MFQKIRKNKFFRKTLVFASVFLILVTSLVLPVLAQAPDYIVGNSNNVGSVDFYYSSPPSTDNNTILFGFIPDYNNNVYKPLFFEGFFNVYNFSINDSPETIRNTLYNDYNENYSTGDFTYYCYYYNADIKISAFEVFMNNGYYPVEEFSNMWNNYFAWEITKNNEVNSLNSEYSSLEETYKNLNTSYNTLQSDYNLLQSNYTTLRAEYDVLYSDYEILEQYWSDLYDKYLGAKSEGYTQALNDYEAFEKGLFSIFNAPFVFVQNIVGFEIFGVSLTEVLVFILILCIGYVLLRFIGGALPL